MVVRMLLLLVMIAQMAFNTIDASDEDEARENMGGEGFANILMLVALLGVLLLAVLIVFAILSVAGMFELELAEPEI